MNLNSASQRALKNAGVTQIHISNEQVAANHKLKLQSVGIDTQLSLQNTPEYESRQRRGDINANNTKPILKNQQDYAKHPPGRQITKDGIVLHSGEPLIQEKTGLRNSTHERGFLIDFGEKNAIRSSMFPRLNIGRNHNNSVTTFKNNQV